MRPRTTAACALVAVLILLSAASTLARQSPFRAGADIVPIYVTADDSRGRAVTDLTASDFRLFEDGREQPIASFSRDPQPFSAVLLLDRSGSMAAHRKVIGEAAGQFVSRLLPDDQVRIGGFSNEIVLAPATFTSDRARLLEVLRSEITRIGGGASPVWAAMSQSLDALEASPLRRVIVLLSDGHDAPPSQRPGEARPRAHHYSDVLDRVRAEGVTVYTMGFLTRQMGRSAYDGLKVYPPSPLLEQLSRVSGGSHAEVGADTDFAARFSAVADELHNQYLLGLSVEVRDGKRHRIDVRVRRDGVKVRARRTYVAHP